MRDRRPIILLDLDNTILDFNTAERTALSRALSRLGIPFDDAMLKRYNAINIRHWEMLEDGILTREQVLVRRFEALYAELGIEGDAFATQENYERLLAEGHWFLPGAEELLDALHRKCRLFLCSNGTQSVQEGRIASAGIAEYFERIFISEAMGVNKPAKAYFDLCFSQIPDFDRSRTLMVGDSLSSDIRGGINAGVMTCWYNPAHKPGREGITPDHEIERLDQLPSLIHACFG